MTNTHVPLARHFFPVPRTEDESDEQEIYLIHGNKKSTCWAEIEKEYRCVILAEAGAGKTYEMTERAKSSKNRNRTAFFIRIEDISDSFEDAFEVGDAANFDRWLNSQDEAWFYLDSVDEARLENPRVFEKAIRRFSAHIKKARQRVHIIISSRPYAWRIKSDCALLERYLPFMPPQEELFDDQGAEKSIVKKSNPPKSALQVYMLDAMDEDDIRTFAKHRKAPNADKLIDDLMRANLIDMAGRPFDLEAILDKWKADQTLEGRRKLLLHNIDLQLEEIDPNRAQRQPLNQEKARTGNQALAAAVILTGKPGIHVPDQTSTKIGVDAKKVLTDWQPNEVRALLERGIFGASLYSMVRFRHREVRELLAAEWFGKYLAKGNSRHAVEALFIREQYGQQVITPRLRPLLPWLILSDGEIRHKILTLKPEIAVEGGDATCLPLADRQAALKDIVKRIVEDRDDRSARNNDAIARIAKDDLTSDALRLIAEHKDHDAAIIFLGRLVWQGEMSECVPLLSEIATNSERNIHARIAATRAVMICGTQDQKARLWQKLNAGSGKLQRDLLAELVRHAAAEASSVMSLSDSIDQLAPYNRYEATGLNRALHSFIDRLPVNASGEGSDPLIEFVDILGEFLSRKPHIQQQECHVSTEFAWLLRPAIHAVERLVAERAESAQQAGAMAIMLKGFTSRSWHNTDRDKYKDQLDKLVPAWPELNDALFWYSVECARVYLHDTKGMRLTDYWQVPWINSYWEFDLNDFERVLDFVKTRTLQDDRLVATSLAHQIWKQSGNPVRQLEDLRKAVGPDKTIVGKLNELLNAPTSAKVRKLKEEEDLKQKWKRGERRESEARTKWIEDLKSRPDTVRNPPGLPACKVSMNQWWLLEEIEGDKPINSLGGGSNWQALIEEFGEDVAHAYKDAAMAHWRAFKPALPSEGCDKTSFPPSLIFAMAGLEIEACNNDGLLDHLSDHEMRHALRYATWELNGFPTWFEAVHQARPNLVLEAVWRELQWEYVNTAKETPIPRILSDLVCCAPWIHGTLVDPILGWIETNQVQNYNTLRYSLQLLVDGKADPVRLTELARNKTAASSEASHLPIWYALWVNSNAESGIPATKQWLETQPEKEASEFAQLFITALIGERCYFRTGGGSESFRTAKHLKALYVLIHQFVRTKDDIERAGKGSYSPELRNDAQDARDRLFNLLSEIPGEEAYVAHSELIREHPDPDWRPWMAKQAHKRAEEDADIEPWSTDQVREFDRVQTLIPATNRQLYDLVTFRLNDLRNWLERGNDSPYRTWQKAASENEMRNLVVGWLNGQSEGRYSCAQENELPNRQRPDILIQNLKVSSPVPIELKLLDKGWSGPKLCERLCNQLAGDYLREETAGHGVLLLIWQGCAAKKNGRSVANG